MKVLLRRGVLLGLVFAMIGVAPAGAMEDLGQMIAQTRALRAKFLKDRHRPLYHFVSPEGVCHPFDPNGSIFWKGQYHLMYIFQNEKGHCWGHTVSNDMLHWRILPPALAPGDGDKGIFSGNAFVNKEGIPTIIYYGVKAGGCIAVAQDDDLIEWKKLSSNPVVGMPRKGHPDYGKYRPCDPHGWVEGDMYYTIFGGNPTGMMATVFKGKELDEWEYVGKLLAHTVDGVALNEDISCPDMFRLGGKDVRVQKAPFEVAKGKTFKLRVFLDRSIIEVYGDDRQCVTQRIYPSRDDALGVSLFCKGGSAKVLWLKAWDMAATNPW